MNLAQAAEYGVAQLQRYPQALVEGGLAQVSEQAPGGFVGDIPGCGGAEEQ
ncbi:hypothetical protein PS854_05718 [Pseudomonas fluorescens]|uniref:Uncharacterized protein n=1 Tax=Pseudomonas fluorescens TaxID=294 RepID=A0A5E7Q3T7_PSEFL|nr:hypothetical protein PS854_05718 [Pseudomonas fluorescens]